MCVSGVFAFLFFCWVWGVWVLWCLCFCVFVLVGFVVFFGGCSCGPFGQEASKPRGLGAWGSRGLYVILRFCVFNVISCVAMFHVFRISFCFANVLQFGLCVCRWWCSHYFFGCELVS